MDDLPDIVPSPDYTNALHELMGINPSESVQGLALICDSLSKEV